MGKVSDGGAGAAQAEQIRKNQDFLEKTLWPLYGQPEAERWAAGRRAMDPVREGVIQSLLNNGALPVQSVPTPTDVPASATPVPIPTGASTPAPVPTGQGSLGVTPTQTTPAPVNRGELFLRVLPELKGINEPAIKAVKTEDDLNKILANPTPYQAMLLSYTQGRVPAFRAYVDTAPKVDSSITVPGEKTVFPTATPTAPATPAPSTPAATPSGKLFDPAAFGFFQTIPTPDIQQGRSWQDVGAMYDKALRDAGELGIARGVESQASAAEQAMRQRGLNNSSLSDTARQAIANMANNQRVQLGAAILPERLNQEAAARGEANQNAWTKAGWESDQLARRKNDARSLMDWYNADSMYQLSPTVPLESGAQIAASYGDLASRNIARSQANQSGLMGLGSLAGTLFAQPWKALAGGTRINPLTLVPPASMNW